MKTEKAETPADYREKVAEALATAAELYAELSREAERSWVPVSERLPASGVKVIVFYRNGCGKARREMARYYRERELELGDEHVSDGCEWDEDGEHCWCPPGWYTAGDCEACEGTQWTIHEDVTHWRPLPSDPEVA